MNNTPFDNSGACERCSFLNHPDLLCCEICDFNPALDVNGQESVARDDQEISKQPQRCNYYNEGLIKDCPGTTTGIVELIIQQLSIEKPTQKKPQRQEETSTNTSLPRFFICNPPCQHVSQKGEDYGAHWSCGYRNIQMLVSSLMQIPEYRQVLFHGSGIVPEIREIQKWIEVAWNNGFDELGGSQFRGKLIDSKQWIGTTECAALLRYFGLRAVIVDFDGPRIMEAENTLQQAQGYYDDQYITTTTTSDRVSASKSAWQVVENQSQEYVIVIDDDGDDDDDDDDRESRRRACGNSSNSSSSRNVTNIKNNSSTNGKFCTSSGVNELRTAIQRQGLTSTNHATTGSTAMALDADDVDIDVDVDENVSMVCIDTSIDSTMCEGADRIVEEGDSEWVKVVPSSAMVRHGNNSHSKNGNDNSGCGGKRKADTTSTCNTGVNARVATEAVTAATTTTTMTTKDGGSATASLNPVARRISLWVRRYFSQHGNTTIRSPTDTSHSMSTVNTTAATSASGSTSSSRTYADCLRHPAGTNISSGASGVVSNSSIPIQPAVPPLYFQHQGHSRTIIGTTAGTQEKKDAWDEDEEALFIFDPCSKGGPIKQSLLDGNRRWRTSVRKSLPSLNKGSYQILYIAPGLVSGTAERERSKILVGTSDLSAFAKTL